MKREGFTLIELLAVIVVLAIIALIAVPTVMNIIAKSNKSAFKDSAYGIIKAGELYYSDKMLDLNGMESDEIFTFPNPTGLDIKGSMPSSGGMIVTRDGKVLIAISNGRYCAKKDFDETEVVVDENLETCKLPEIVTSSDNCIKNTSSVCPKGTKVNVKVNYSENYDFYVLSDTGRELTLIMDRNLGSNVAWISKEDYMSANTDSTVCEYDSCNDGAPLTVLEALEMRTNNWTNVETFSYTLTDTIGQSMYKSIERKNVRARLLTAQEAFDLKCVGMSNGSCQRWLYSNLDNANKISGYWTSSANSNTTDSAWFIRYVGDIFLSKVCSSEYYGIRPIIKISKKI